MKGRSASGWAGFQLEYQECLVALASLQTCAADPSRGRTGLMEYLESTPLELSNDVNFVEILIKTTENTLQYRNISI